MLPPFLAPSLSRGTTPHEWTTTYTGCPVRPHAELVFLSASNSANAGVVQRRRRCCHGANSGPRDREFATALASLVEASSLITSRKNAFREVEVLLCVTEFLAPWSR